MPRHTESDHTPAHLTQMAKELRAMAEALDRAAAAMHGLEVENMPLPRANAEKIGITSLQSFIDGTRDVLRDVGLEHANGMSVQMAIEKVLSGWRVGPRKRRERKLKKMNSRKKADKEGDDVNPVHRAS